MEMNEESKIEAQKILDAAGPIIPVNCPSCEYREDLEKRVEELEAKIKRVEDYRNRCGILRTEPSTAGLNKALVGERQ